MNDYWVYVFVNDAGEAEYVGLTGDLKSRLSAHKYSSPWWNASLSVETIPCIDELDAVQTEKLLISKLSPRSNKTAGGETGGNRIDPELERINAEKFVNDFWKNVDEKIESGNPLTYRIAMAVALRYRMRKRNV